MEHGKYLITFSLPDGKHLQVMNAHPSVVEDHARRFVSHNPDGKFISVVPLQSEQHLQEAIDALRAENPGRPLANELGLDTPNRIMADPQIARDLAAQQQAATMASSAAPPQPGGGFGCC